MRTFEEVKFFSPVMSFYHLAIEAIRDADLTEFLMQNLDAVQELLRIEKDYFFRQHDEKAMGLLEDLQMQTDRVQGMVELKSILQEWD